MQRVKSVLAIIGLVAIVALAAAAIEARALLARFDPDALPTYRRIVESLLKSGNLAEATVWRAQVKDGLTFDDVDQAIQSVAAAMNIKDVGALPLGDHVSAMQGKTWRKLKIYLYCNPLTAAHMIDYSDAFSAFLPCRVALLEDGKGKLWIYTLNMDMLIYGGKPLPPELKQEALNVKTIMQTVLSDGARGEF
jgi:uncharacterized protein (DUF302 family)